MCRVITATSENDDIAGSDGGTSSRPEVFIELRAVENDSVIAAPHVKLDVRGYSFKAFAVYDSPS